ncbi:hypothetical protein FRC12_016174 [Ceratobasidium sp. 428]|nr:hypothetical protein FRC12_016174 [Ceratobasidium sp. 428]
MPSSRQVLLIPELATLVARYSTRQDCARLLRTSKLLYNIAVPFVWECVPCAKHLLLLLDGAFDTSRYSGPKNSAICLVDCDDIPNPFIRFDFYAPHVKYLDVYGPTGVMFKITSWKVLVARAQRQLLLPNLHTMTMMTNCNSSGSCQPMWVGTFSSPSLVNLEITADNLSNAPTVSYQAASFIMKSLTVHCPKIESLGLFPSALDGNHVEDAESSLIAFLSGDRFYEYASNLTSLTHLSCTFAWFQVPALRILGRLPHLESIAVCGVDHVDYISELTEDLFPMLRRLTLHGSDHFNASETLKTTQMLKNLTILHVKLDINVDELDTDENTWFVEDFFPLLLNAPLLTNLNVDADSSQDRGNDLEVGESVLRVL